jgi:hypothetical protein
VRDVVHRFAALNPYRRDVVPGSVLKIEEDTFSDGVQRVVYAYTVSAKRYAIVTYTGDTRRS